MGLLGKMAQFTPRQIHSELGARMFQSNRFQSFWISCITDWPSPIKYPIRKPDAITGGTNQPSRYETL